MASPFNYSYAYNEDGILINVSQANRDEKYKCPICGAEMTPHMGKIRRWHFVHKNAANCSYESYLHKLAKVRIREAFLYSEKFNLSYNAAAICSMSCPYKNSPKCSGEKKVEFNLRKFYDICELEATYHNFRADLLLSSSEVLSRPPILIEIKVTHGCTEEKIKDGTRIIEIPISSESQIDDIVEKCSIAGVRFNSNRMFSVFGNNSSLNATLYNFNKVESFDPRESLHEVYDAFSRKNSIVFILERNGRFRHFDCNCFDVESKIPKDAHYFVTNIATPFKEIFQNFSKQGVKVRNCFLCKFSKKDFDNERLCVLYKKYGLPRKPFPQTALTCNFYREDFEYNTDSLETQTTEMQVGNTYKSYLYICNDIL